MITYLSRLLCLLGFHGPNVLGNTTQYRSSRTRSMARKCECCGTIWQGQEVTRNNVRTLGDWKRVK